MRILNVISNTIKMNNNRPRLKKTKDNFGYFLKEKTDVKVDLFNK